MGLLLEGDIQGVQSLAKWSQYQLELSPGREKLETARRGRALVDVGETLPLAILPAVLCVDCNLCGGSFSCGPSKWWYGRKFLYNIHKDLWGLRIFLRLKRWFWAGCDGATLNPALGRLRKETHKNEACWVIYGVLGQVTYSQKKKSLFWQMSFCSVLSAYIINEGYIIPFHSCIITVYWKTWAFLLAFKYWRYILWIFMSRFILFDQEHNC